MNQGALEVVKQEMARVNISILGISELKWTWMGKFNSDYHYIYYCGKESLRRNRVALTVHKRVWNAVLGYSLKKWQNDPGLFSSQAVQYHSNRSLCPNLGFPGGSDGKVSAHNAGDPGSIPWLGRSPREGNGNPLQYSCLENSMDGGAWWGPWGRKELDTTEQLHFHFHMTQSLMPEINWSVLWRLTRSFRINIKKKKIKGKRCPFHYRDWDAKVGNQEIPGETGKFGLAMQSEAKQRLTEFSQESTLVIANTLFQQHKRQLYTWTSSDGQHQNQIDYILCSWRWRSSIQSVKARPGADCGSDHELLVAKFRIKWTTRPFRYDLNQIPYDYTVEVTNRFKGLDLRECPKYYGWRFVTLYRIRELVCLIDLFCLIWS